MTTAVERTRALRLAGEFLREIRRSQDGDPEWGRQANVILRHYPDTDGIAQWARIGRLIDPPWQWLTPEQNSTPDPSDP